MVSKVISPRIILTRVALGDTFFYATSAHAPTNVAPEQEKFAFWKLLRDTLRSLPHRRCIVLGIDSNADDKDTAPGSNQLFVQELMEELSGDDVAQHHENLTPTWRSSQGSHRRLDRLITFGEVWHQAGSYKVHTDENISTIESADHSMITTRLMLRFGNAPGPGKRPPRMRFDPFRLEDPGCVAAFRGAVSSLADVVQASWWSSTDEYLEFISKELYNLQQFYFAAPASKLPRKPWLSQGTWALVKTTPKVRTAYLQATRAKKTATLQFFFQAWSKPAGRATSDLRAVEWHRAYCQWGPVAIHAKAHSCTVKDKVKADREAWTSALAQEAAAAADHGDTSTLYRIAKQLRQGQRPKGHSSLITENGTLLFDPEDIAADWLAYWAGLYRGQVTTVGQLKSAPQCNAGYLVGEAPAPPFDWCSFPDTSPGHVADIIAHLPGRRAVGPDALRHDVVKAAGEGCPRMLSSLFEACLLQQRAPVHLKGGTSFNIHKKGPTHIKDNYRGVVAETAFAKTYTDLISMPLLPSYRDVLVPESQAGCVKGRGTASAGAATAGWISRHNATRRCWAILFLDLSKAFDTVFRELALGPRDVSLAKLIPALMQRGVPPDVASAVHKYLKVHGPRVLDGGIEPAAAQLIADWHTATWSHVRPNDGRDVTPVTDDTPVASSTIGARQGDKLGAIIFNVIYDIMLAEVRERLKELGVSSRMAVPTDAVPWHTNVNPEGDLEEITVDQSTYVDDLAELFEADTPAQLIDSLTQAVNVLYEVLSRYGLKINFGPEKTAIMLRLFGVGARAAYNQLRDEAGDLGLDTKAGRCGIVHHYKHVGTTLQTSGRSMLDAQAKATKMQKTYGPIAHTVFGSCHLSQATRASLSCSLLDSQLLFGAELWLQDDPVARRRTQAAYMRPRRQILGHPRFGHTDVSDDQVCKQLGHSALDMAITCRRLRLLPLLLDGPAYLRAIHCAEPKPPHARLLLDDLTLLWEHAEELRHLPSPAMAPAQWACYITASRPRWKRIVRAIALLPNRPGVIAQQAPPPTAAEVEEAEAQRSTLPRAQQLLQCDLCQKWCRGWRGLAGHRHRAHRIVATARAYCITSTCPACGKDYGSRPRAVHHLQYSSKVCREMMRTGRLHRYEDSLIEAADQADRELVRADVLAGRGRLVARQRRPPRPAD